MTRPPHPQRQARGSSAVVELVLGIIHQTEKAWLVTGTGFEDDAVWIPKSLCKRIERKGRYSDPPCCPLGVWTFEMPEFLAAEREMI